MCRAALIFKRFDKSTDGFLQEHEIRPHLGEQKNIAAGLGFLQYFKSSAQFPDLLDASKFATEYMDMRRIKAEA
eukprot:SAG11_NODE_17494_length_517_cov_0.708134_1_plen_73_part_10